MADDKPPSVEKPPEIPPANAQYPSAGRTAEPELERPQVKRKIPAPPKGLTAHIVVRSLLILLGATVALHYVAVLCIACFCDADVATRKELLDFIGDTLGKLWPAEVGLVGGATAYYFSSDREREQDKG